MEKIKLGISACLLGQRVRYDGGHKLDPFLKDTLGKYIEFVPVCPEAELGLGGPPRGDAAGRGTGGAATGSDSKRSGPHAWHERMGRPSGQETRGGSPRRLHLQKPLSLLWHGAGRGLPGKRAARSKKGSVSLPGPSWSAFLSCRWRKPSASMIPNSESILSSDSLN